MVVWDIPRFPRGKACAQPKLPSYVQQSAKIVWWVARCKANMEISALGNKQCLDIPKATARQLAVGMLLDRAPIGVALSFLIIALIRNAPSLPNMITLLCKVA